MSVVCFVNNRLGWRAVEWVVARGDQIAGLVLHPQDRRRYGAEMCAAAGVADDRVFDGSRLADADVVARLRALGADYGLSVLFGYRLSRDVFTMFPRGCFNLHPALLPYNRGADPNVWAIVDGTPAGATLHWIDERIDTGDIVAQARLDVLPTDTGETLYRRLEDHSLQVLAAGWPLVTSGRAPRTPQPAGGSAHRRADTHALEYIDLDRTYTGRELIDRLRALTFPPYPSAFFEAEGRRIRVRVVLEEDSQQA